MAIAEVSLNPADGLDVQTKGTMKALVYHGHGRIAWQDKPRPTIQRRAMPLCALPPRPFAGPISTFFKEIFRPLPMDAFWAMKALGRRAGGA